MAGIFNSASGVNSCHSYTAHRSHEHSHAHTLRTHKRLLPTPRQTITAATQTPRTHVHSKQQFTQTINPSIRPNFLLTQLYLPDLLQLQTNTAPNAKQPSKPGHHTPRHNMASTSMHRAITTQRLHSCDASSVIHTQPTRSRYHTLNIISIS